MRSNVVSSEMAEGVDYRSEQARLDSYEDWPHDFVHPSDLAAAGFYYMKVFDHDVCNVSTVILKYANGRLVIIPKASISDGAGDADSSANYHVVMFRLASTQQPYQF